VPTRVLVIAVAALAATLPATTQPVLAQQAARTSDSFEKLMGDFIFYVKIDKPDLAADIGEVILAKGLTDREFAAAIEDANLYTDFEDALGKALQHPELEPVIAEMDRLYLSGKKAEARDPQEISRNISMLTGNLRARRMARERLIFASEYAMVQLLEAYLDPDNLPLRTQVETVMIDMGPGAVMPLGAALPHLSPSDQESVVKVLGLLGYPAALPFIAELMLAPSTGDPVRNACELAVDRIGPGGETLDPATLYYDLAQAYFNERSELTIFPGEDHQLLWSYDPSIGLQMTAIATPVFHEAMAMRLAEKSMRLDAVDSMDAVALWTAANFKREIESPASYANPVYPEDKRDAMYFAVSFGPEINQAVLERAMNSSNTQLARRAIEALSLTAGGQSLWTGSDGRAAPLLDALQYPDRRVQYEAALVLGAAQPSVGFPGAERVVPTLAGAVRDAGDQYALIITPDTDAYNEIRALVSGLGYTPLAFAGSVDGARQSMADTPGIDLLVIDMPSTEGAAGVLVKARMAPKLAVVPTLILTSPEGTIDLRTQHRGNRLVAVRQRSVTGDMLRNSIEDLVLRGAGGKISAEESRQYTAEALTVLHDLAMSDSNVLDAAEATTPLIVALGDTSGQTQLRIAEVLAWIDQPRAQVAVMDAALDASGEQQARLLDVVAGSARRYGNLLEPRQINQLFDLARLGSDREATSAAALMGSLDLPNRELVPLILEPAPERVGSR